ncbi:MAG: hypothetical protein WAU70_15230 [Flavobacteriales bacterium]
MNYLNLDKTLLRTCAFLCLLFLLGGFAANAQTAAPTSITLRIDGLSNDERDALNQQLVQRGDARIAFACIPAGIIVLQATDADRSTDSLRLRALPGLLASVAPGRIHEEPGTVNEAELICANARNNR